MRYKEFVQAVAAWDLWILDSPQRQRGENLNNLLGFIGREAFVDAFVKDPNADELPTFKEITKFLVARRDRYVRQVLKEQLESSDARLDGFGNVFKIIFATDFISEIGHAVLDHPEAEDLKYVCVVNPVTNTCSLRSRDGETDIGKIAAMCDGGGHHSAAGFPVPFKEHLTEMIFGILNKLNY
jgi:oligoribonuclease NrnB/cAMP/cGMP phosphodiesterase (DHH superfamily)